MSMLDPTIDTLNFSNDILPWSAIFSIKFAEKWWQALQLMYFLSVEATLIIVEFISYLFEESGPPKRIFIYSALELNGNLEVVR